MPLRTACSSCGKKLQVRDELAGKKVKCPDCGKVFIAAVGDAAAIKASPAQPAPSKSAPPPMAKDKVTLPPTVKKPMRAPVEDEDDDELEDRPVTRGRVDTAKKSGSRMLIWLILGGVLLIGGGAAGYYFFFMGPPPTVGPIVRKGGPPKVPVDTTTEDKEEKTETKEGVPEKTNGLEKSDGPVDAALANLVPGDALFFATASGDFFRNKAFEAAGMAFGVKIDDTFQKAAGMNIGDLERVSMFTLGGFAEAAQGKEPPVAIVVQTNKPIDQKRVALAVKQMMAGKTPAMTAQFPNQQTILIGKQADLITYHQKKGKTKATGVLERALREASTSKGAIFAVVVPPEAEEFGAMALKDAPPFFAPFLKTKSVLASVEVTDKLKLRATLFMEDAAAAADAKKGADELIGFAVGMLSLAGKDPQSAALAMTAQQALRDLKINVQDKEVLIAFETDMKVVMDAVMKGLMATKGAAAAAGDTNNLKQISLAWLNYHDVYKSYPPQTFGKGLSWRVAILPYLEQGQLYQQFKLDEPWDSEHNKKLIPLMPPIYAGGGKTKPGFTVIQTFVGKKTINADPKKGMAIPKITDGLSNTIIVAEGAKAVEWTKPDDITVTDKEPIQLGGGDPKFTLAALGDGSIRRLPRDLDQKILRLLIDPNDGTPIPDFESSGPKKAAPPVFKLTPTPPTPKKAEDKKPEAPGAKEIPEAKSNDKAAAKEAAAGKQLPAPKVAKIARGKRGDVGGGDKLTANLANHDVVVIKLEGIPATVKGFEIIRGASFKAGGESVNFNSVLGSPPGPVWVGAVVPANAKSITITLPGNIAPFTVNLPAKVEDEVKAYD